MEQIMSEPQGGRPRTEWPQVKHEVRLQRDISSHKKVTVSTWNGEVRVDIRTWEDNFPNKKGLSLTLPRWKTLLSYQEDLTDALRQQLHDKIQYHLGGGQFVTVNPQYKGLDLRQYFIPAGMMKQIHPTRKGIVLSEDEWNNLQSCVEEIRKCIPELELTQMCSERADHYFHLDSLECKECHPFETLDSPDQY